MIIKEGRELNNLKKNDSDSLLLAFNYFEDKKRYLMKVK